MPDDVFLSYTHVKDEYNAVSLFRKHLETELRKKTGNVKLTLFQDKDRIRGGENWEERLRSELESAHVLLILVSPTWLKSAWCRRECEIYRDASPPGAPRPIVPILWDSVEESDLAAHELDIYHELLRLQTVEWDELQYEDWSDPKLQKAASRLAFDVKKKLREHTERNMATPAEKAAVTRKRRKAAATAALTRTRRKAGAKAALTRQRRTVAQKAAVTRRRRAAARKAAATRAAKK